MVEEEEEEEEDKKRKKKYDIEPSIFGLKHRTCSLKIFHANCSEVCARTVARYGADSHGIPRAIAPFISNPYDPL